MKYLIETYRDKKFLFIPELVELGLHHCFTTSDMDMGLRTNGSVESVRENFKLIYDFMGISPKQIFNGFQTHSDNVKTVLSIEDGQDYAIGKYFPETDGLMTNIKEIGLVTRFADCTPILLYDPVKNVHANIHSGWKGTLKEIGGKAVDKMVQVYETNPQDIKVILGPAIGKDDFEVEIDVMQLFKDKFDFHDEVIRRKNQVKYLIDLKAIIERTLLTKGIGKDNIYSVDISTYSDRRFHSYRRDKDNFGQMACITILFNSI